MTETFDIKGYCEQRFSVVKEAFRKNFESGQEVGASFAATIDGKYVVDIWGGYADEAQTRPWERDTIVNVYSTTKVMTTLCALILVDRGQLDLDAPVARYWPEFAQAGKENIPVRYILTHKSGVAAFNEKTTAATYCDWEHVIRMLEKQKPWWEPGKYSGYHALTFGHLIGEVVRRITGKTLGTFFQEEVAKPLNADFFIGLPEKHDWRVADLIAPPVISPGDPGYVDLESVSELSKRAVNDFSDDPNTVPFSLSRAWRGAEIPAANGHGNARAVARVGAVLACGGELDGIRLLGMSTILKAIEEQYYGIDRVLGIPMRRGLHFVLNSKEMPLGPNPCTFSGSGWGGSRLIIDPDIRLSWSYVMNKMANLGPDPRSMALSQALNTAL